MRRNYTTLLLLFALLAAFSGAARADEPPRKVGDDHRMDWFRDARFGMFIHWGLYSVPAGVWNGQEVPGIGEWILNNAKIPLADYEPLQQQFNPVKFDADAWVKTAKDAGMKYIVITSKHHDGFGLWDSKLTDWDIGGTPFHQDVIKELAASCKKYNLKLCLYHSIMDWHHPDYLPRREWDPRPEEKADYDRYVAYLKGQLKELLTNYGPIGILWFDGEWEPTWTHERGADLYAYVRSLQPDIIINNRVDKGRQGMQGLNQDGDFAGDYGTPEQEIPPTGLPGVDWESCMTMNDTWGFKKNDQNWKSSETLLKNLVDIASKGGNYLLNVGPNSLGEMPAASIERLHQMGDWLKTNGEAIYGTGASPFPKPLPWGRVTQKPGTLYLHVYDPGDGTILLPGLTAKIGAVTILGERRRMRIPWKQTENGVQVTLPAFVHPSPITVLKMNVTGPVTVTEMPLAQQVNGSIVLNALDATVNGTTARYETDKNCIGFWTDTKETVGWRFRLNRPGIFAVEAEIASEAASAGKMFTISAGGQAVSSNVPATGGWDNFVRVPLGTITLKTPGEIKLAVTPDPNTAGPVMNLRAIRLIPQ